MSENGSKVNNKYAQIFSNRIIEMRDPKKLIIITAVWMKNNPDKRELVEAYYDPRADRGTDEVFNAQVEATGFIHTPIFVTDVPNVGEVVVAGKRRTHTAQVLGFAEVPIIMHDPDTDISIELEIMENEARSESTVLERAVTFKKALQHGISKEKLSAMTGLSPVMVYNTILVGELPKFVLEMVNNGELTQTAALQLVKTYGEAAPKGSGLSKVYSQETQDKMREALANMSLEAKLIGGGKRVSVRQARSTSARGVDEMSPRNWDAMIESEDTPDDYKALIQVFRNKLSWKQARGLNPENLGWLSKKEPAPKVKVPKEPKPSKKEKTKSKPVVDESFDPAELFR